MPANALLLCRHINCLFMSKFSLQLMTKTISMRICGWECDCSILWMRTDRVKRLMFFSSMSATIGERSPATPAVNFVQQYLQLLIIHSMPGQGLLLSFNCAVIYTRSIMLTSLLLCNFILHNCAMSFLSGVRISYMEVIWAWDHAVAKTMKFFMVCYLSIHISILFICSQPWLYYLLLQESPH